MLRQGSMFIHAVWNSVEGLGLLPCPEDHAGDWKSVFTVPSMAKCIQS